MSSSGSPEISLFANADCGDLSLSRLKEQIEKAFPDCLRAPGPEAPLLDELTAIEISLVSDEAIAEVHGEFMDDPSPTDVITFHHGEILASVDTARREGADHGNSTGEELLLYVIHGLLHLNGHTDASEPARATMHRVQEAIHRRVLDRD